MSYKVNFLDNQTVTAEAINSISETLGGGVLAFNDDMTYGVDDLNAISENLISKGVSQGCDLSISEEGIFISQGVLFMGDGKRVEIDSDGILLPYVAGEKNYIWFYHDEVMGFVAPRCTTSEPAGEDYVVLGEVREDGALSGRADLAVMKNSHLGLNHFEEHFLSVQMWGPGSEDVLLQEVELEKVGVRYMIAISDGITSKPRKNVFSGYVDFETGKSFGIHATTPATTSLLDWGVSYGSETEGKLQIGFGAEGGVVFKIYLRFERGSDNVIKIYRSSVRGLTTDGYDLPRYQTVRLIFC